MAETKLPEVSWWEFEALVEAEMGFYLLIYNGNQEAARRDARATVERRVRLFPAGG